jgi:anti-anti-sigma factor
MPAAASKPGWCARFGTRPRAVTLSGPTAATTVVIKCRPVSFIDAAGVGVLAEAFERVEGIRLADVGPTVRRVLDIVGLTATFLDSDVH